VVHNDILNSNLLAPATVIVDMAPRLINDSASFCYQLRGSFEQFRAAKLVLRWLLDMVDDDNFDLGFGGFQLQAEPV
jgi:hypothetical protein